MLFGMDLMCACRVLVHICLCGVFRLSFHQTPSACDKCTAIGMHAQRNVFVNAIKAIKAKVVHCL